MRKRVRTISLVMTCACIVATSSGCVLVPFIQAFKEVGATEGDRQRLLGEELKKFTDGLQWGNKVEALSVVSDEAREEVASQLRAVGDSDKVVDTKVDDIQWGEGSFSAKAFVKVRHYTIPFYVVKTRVEEQRWEFSAAAGWRLKSRVVKSESLK
jgi:hypothetical protein